MNPTGNTILVTGGGSGIGAALAQRWHAAGNTVIVAGRRQDALDGVIAGREGMHARTLDVASADAIVEFAAELRAAFPALNVLVNNAGIMRLEDAARGHDLTGAEETVVTNLLGPIRLTNALIDHLTAQSDATIVNVTSGLAFVPMVDAAVYSATKAAIHSWTVSLRDALSGRAEVIELTPPGVQTDLTPGQADRPGYLPLADFIDEVMTQFGEQPTPREIMVERVRWQRDAERQGRFDETFRQFNDFARKARAQSGG